MAKLLVICHSGFSDTNANGITMKNLLSAFTPEDVAEFYCDVQPPDYSAAHRYFRVTDSQMLKAFFGKKFRREFAYDANFTAPDVTVSNPQSEAAPKRIPAWLKKFKYNFAVKWTRENLWKISPWGRRRLWEWVREFSPDAIEPPKGISCWGSKWLR